MTQDFLAAIVMNYMSTQCFSFQGVKVTRVRRLCSVRHRARREQAPRIYVSSWKNVARLPVTEND